MKSAFSHVLLLTFGSLALLGGCGQDLTPVPGASPSPAVSPSASASGVASPVVSPTPSASMSPSAIPTVLPDPSASPTLSPSPSATPSVVFGPSVSPETPITSFTFRARLLTSKSELLPVVKAAFKAQPYNLTQIQQTLISRNAAGPKPVAPQQSDPKYQLEQKVCNGSGCTTEASVDVETYRSDLQFYQVTTLPNWEKQAYAGLEDEIKTASQGREEVNLVTDANGEALMRLQPGTWYFSGKYTAGGTVVVWDAIPFQISATTRTVELTR